MRIVFQRQNMLQKSDVPSRDSTVMQVPKLVEHVSVYAGLCFSGFHGCLGAGECCLDTPPCTPVGFPFRIPLGLDQD